MTVLTEHSLFNITERVKPILKWAGGKSGLLPQLIEYFPTKFNKLVEPFVGGGAVFFSLKPDVPAVINDINIEVVELYKVVRDNPYKLMEGLDEISAKYSEAFYYSTRSGIPHDSIEGAVRTIFLNKTGFNGLYRQNSKGEFNVPYGKRTCCPNLYDKENLIKASNHLKNAAIECLDFEEILNKVGEGDFVYCDPPYEPLTVTSYFNAYKANGFSQQDQIRLHNAANKAVDNGAYVILSNSTAEFITNLYKDWQGYQVSARRYINSKSDGRGCIFESLFVKHP